LYAEAIGRKFCIPRKYTQDMALEAWHDACLESKHEDSTFIKKSIYLKIYADHNITKLNQPLTDYIEETDTHPLEPVSKYKTRSHIVHELHDIIEDTLALTDRQKFIVKSIANGKPQTAIAEELGCTQGCISLELKNICKIYVKLKEGNYVKNQSRYNISSKVYNKMLDVDKKIVDLYRTGMNNIEISNALKVGYATVTSILVCANRGECRKRVIKNNYVSYAKVKQNVAKHKQKVKAQKSLTIAADAQESTIAP
jgi:DNA-binding NarL/FixJ family response regulator